MNRHLSLKPKSMRRKRGGGDSWWYETPAGLDIYVENMSNRGTTISNYLITWKQVRAALERKDRAADAKVDAERGDQG